MQHMQDLKKGGSTKEQILDTVTFVNGFLNGYTESMFTKAAAESVTDEESPPPKKKTKIVSKSKYSADQACCSALKKLKIRNQHFKEEEEENGRHHTSQVGRKYWWGLIKPFMKEKKPIPPVRWAKDVILETLSVQRKRTEKFAREDKQDILNEITRLETVARLSPTI